MNVSIRRADPADYQAVCELLAELDALHAEHLPDVFRKTEGPAREWDYYCGLLADDNVAVFVAEADGRVVGLAHVAIREAPAIPIFVPRRYAVVDAIGVRSGFRRRGIGRRLLDAVHAWAVEKGASSVELNVHEFNQEAIAFYRAVGYETLRRQMGRKLTEG
jgi:ribosomal protein S18 acetylase RimI-like enzyme